MHYKINKNGNKIYYIDVNDKMKKHAFDFASEIITTNNQYDRLNPDILRHSRDIATKDKIRIQRTFVGKLGEIIFLKFLYEKGKPVNFDGMFDIYEGAGVVDDYDFVTKDRKSVDIKTGFRPNHKNLLINVEQFYTKNKKKDYYVGIKLDGQDKDVTIKEIDIDSINYGIIYGYAEFEYLKEHCKTRNFGEGNARYIAYDNLLPINDLVEKF